MKYSYLTKYIAFLLVITLVVVPTVYANHTGVVDDHDKNGVGLLRKDGTERPMKEAVSCEVLVNRIEKRIEVNERILGNRKEAYNRLSTRLTNLIERLKEKDLDTSKLEEHLLVLNEKFETALNSNSSYVAKLNDAKGHACDEDRTVFKSLVEDARKLLEQTRTDAKAVREYFRTVILEDLKALNAEFAINKHNNETRVREINPLN